MVQGLNFKNTAERECPSLRLTFLINTVIPLHNDQHCAPRNTASLVTFYVAFMGIREGMGVVGGRQGDGEGSFSRKSLCGTSTSPVMTSPLR